MRITTHIGLPTVAALLLSGVASADWAAKSAFDPIKNESRCVVESTRQTMHDGYNDTEVYLQVDKTSLLIHTRSNIDASKSDIGVAVDKRELIPMDKLYLDQNVVFDKQIATIVEQFKKGLKAAITLHFWPTYPDTGPKAITFSLIGFTKAYEEFADCQ
jgi:hypothetical protein